MENDAVFICCRNCKEVGNIFETNTVGVEEDVLHVDDIIETSNHFRCIELIIDKADAKLTEKVSKNYI